jgi:DNA integrity scanning protein DisA with diadenylate cyclase activity
MLDKLQDLDNLILKLNTTLSKDKRFKNELNHDHYLKKMIKKEETKNIEIPLKIIPEYSVNLNLKKNNINLQYKELLKDLEDLINKLTSKTTSKNTLDISEMLEKLEKLKKINSENLDTVKDL